MVTTRRNLWMAAMLGALIGVGMVGLHPALAEDDPNAIPYLFAHAGGPYYGKVGVPIEFNASTSYIGDGSTIEGYHWDWDMDKNYECVTLPICTHTWHSAFAGEVWMQVFGPGDNMAWDTARVTVTGPETFLTFTLSSAFADLHVYDPKGRHVGLNYASGAVDKKIPGASYQRTVVLAEENAQASTQTVALPLYAAGDYKIKLVGAADDSFQLNVAAVRDGQAVVQQIHAGEVCQGESVTLNVCAGCPNGQLDMMCGELTCLPGLAVTPDQVTLTVEPDAVYDVALQVCETYGKVALDSVTLQCSHITGPGNLIASSNISFDSTGFTVEPDCQHEVHARIAIPKAFMGIANGSITVSCSAGVTKSVPVTLRTPGACVPVTVQIGPYTGTVGTPITFDASECHDPDGYIDQYAWDWDNDGHVDDYTMTPTISHTWDCEFSGTVTCLVIDNDGFINSMTVEVTVTAP